MAENTVRDKATDLRFIINLNDHNPPYAHVYQNRGLVARIELETLRFMRPVPSNPKARLRIREALLRHQSGLIIVWTGLHR